MIDMKQIEKEKEQVITVLSESDRPFHYVLANLLAVANGPDTLKIRLCWKDLWDFSLIRAEAVKKMKAKMKVKRCRKK